MPRPKGSKNKPKDENGAGPGIGHNAPPPILTDDQLQALFHQHLRKVRALKETLASVNGELRAAYKQAKAELGEDAKAAIADALLLETDDGQAKMEAAIARQAKVARWLAVPLGAQPDFFDTDRSPATDRAFAAGKAARLKGEPLKPPHAPEVPQYDSWIEGWHAGEKALVEAQKRDDAVMFDAGIGEAEATYTQA